MKCFFDTEFNDSGEHGLELISIGMIRDDGQTLYLINKDFDESHAVPWVRENVLPELGSSIRFSQEAIKNIVSDFCQNVTEFVAWYGTYDYFLLMQLFGGAGNKPDHWPWIFTELQHLLDEVGGEPPKQVAAGEHNAETDAIHIMKLYEWAKVQYG